VKLLQHRAEWIAFMALRGGIRALPHPASRRMGSALGTLTWAGAPGYRRLVDRNLARAFPDWGRARRRRVGRACFRHFGAMICDIMSFGRFGPVELCERLTLDGWEHVQAAEETPGGTLYLTAHLGNWEIAAHPVGLYRGALHVVARPFNNPLLWKPMLAERERLGHRVIDKHGAARDVFRVLRSGGRVGMVVDQRVRPSQGGIEVPFFGHPALTTALPAKVALRTRSLAIPTFGFPQPGGRYRVRFEAPIPPEGEPHSEEAIAALTERYLRSFEEAIRTHPEQWLWMHDRWREA
jgi:KDO2-lipid IV(A) lauroyltransferase